MTFFIYCIAVFFGTNIRVLLEALGFALLVTGNICWLIYRISAAVSKKTLEQSLQSQNGQCSVPQDLAESVEDLRHRVGYLEESIRRLEKHSPQFDRLSSAPGENGMKENVPECTQREPADSEGPFYENGSLGI